MRGTCPFKRCTSSLRALLVALLLAGCTRAPSTPVSPRHRVVMISIDGLRPDYLTSAARIPTLRGLVERGAHASVKSIWPTVTYPAHTTLVTGTRPSKHGIANNLPFDPLGENHDGWYWYARDIRVPTLWDEAHRHGYTTANVYWPVTVGAAIDWSVPQIWRSKTDEDDKLLAALSTPGLTEELVKRYGRVASEHRSDAERTEAAEHILETKHPGLALVYLTDLDTVQHASGPMSKEALATLEAIDGDVARVVRAAGDATIVIVSDHGFLPIGDVIRPSVLLRAAGLLDVANGKVTGYRAAAWKAGGSCAIVVKNPADVEKVTTLFREAAVDPKNGIAKVHPPVIPGSALVLEAADGFAFANGFEGPLTEATTEKGAHGYSPDRTEMNATLIMAGPGVRHADLGVVEMIDIAPTVAKLLGVTLAQAEGKALDVALAP